MTLQQLRYFLAAAEHGSFSAAAEALLMAQPSLSDQIRRLEAELGVPLFTRAGRRLVLTEAGRMLQPEAERTLGAAEQGRGVRPRGPHPGGAAPSPSARSAPRITTCSAGWSRTSASAIRGCASASWARTRSRSPTPSATGGSRPG